MQCCNGIIDFCIIVRCVLCISMHQSSTRFTHEKDWLQATITKAASSKRQQAAKTSLMNIYASFQFPHAHFSCGGGLFLFFFIEKWVPINCDEKLKTKTNKPYVILTVFVLRLATSCTNEECTSTQTYRYGQSKTRSDLL